MVVTFFRYPLDYGEAPLLDQATRLAAGHNIYRADITAPPYTISNYPPLYVLTLVPFVKLFGPTFTAGRAISVLCTLASAAFLALTIYTLYKDRVAALVTGMLFLAVPYVVHWSAFLRIDMLALALSTAALYVVARWPAERWSTVVTAVLLVGAIYTRQSYVLAAPLAAFVWLWAHSRRRAVELALLVGGLGLLLFLVLNLLTRGGFFYNIVSANVNEFGMDRLGRSVKDLLETAPILLILGAVFVILAPVKGMPAWPLLVPYLIGAFLSVLTSGKIGSNVNYFLELAAALSLIGGTYIWWSRGRPWLRNFLLLILVLQGGWLLRQTMERPVAYVSFRANDRAAMNELDDLLAKVDGPVLADEHMGLMTLQERPLYVQPFEVTQLSRAGRWDQTALLQSIEGHEFPLILVYQFPYSSAHEERWTPEMLAAIEEYYKPAQNLAGNVVYRPKGEQVTAGAPPPVQQSGFHPADVNVGPVLRVSQAPYVFEPSIAVNPHQSEQLAATVVTASDSECEEPDCQVNLLLYNSSDGGATWSEQMPFGSPRQDVWDGMSRFGPDGTLYALGLRNRIAVNRSAADSPAGPYQMVPADTVNVMSSWVFNPWLDVNADDGELFLTYAGRYRDNLGINLKRSTSQGDEWTFAVPVDKGVPLSDLEKGQATPPLGAQTMLGGPDHLAVSWTWSPGFWRAPTGVWIATSVDGGASFSSSRQIAETWSLASGAAHNGTYYLVFRHGTEHEQQVVLARSDDGGMTWSTRSVSGDLPVSTGWTIAPGVSVAPNGTIDIVFYAQSSSAPACTADAQEWRRAFLDEIWTDTCNYDVYYTYSKESGKTFSEPVQLNEEPISGEKFVRPSGSSFAGFRLGIASADDSAFPMWIETQGDDGTQAYTVRIER